jgi:hypothetical protein
MIYLDSVRFWATYIAEALERIGWPLLSGARPSGRFNVVLGLAFASSFAFSTNPARKSKMPRLDLPGFARFVGRAESPF